MEVEGKLDYLLNVWCDYAQGVVIVLAVHSSLSVPCLSGVRCQLSCLPGCSLNLWNDLA